MHIGSDVLKPVSGLQVWAQFGILGLWGLAVATSILFAPVWIVRRIRGRIPPGTAIRVRLWPLLASVCAIAFLLFFMVGMGDPFARLGGPTIVSVGIMGASLLFAMFAAVGVVYAIGVRKRSLNRVAWWHSMSGSALHLLVSAYLYAHGIIGLATWA